MVKKIKSDVAYSFLNLFFRLISGPVTMFLISVYLLPNQQGYWYLFGGITAFSVLADLGFTNIIMQFSAHEYINFKEKNDNIFGARLAMIKYGNLFKFILKWSLKVLIILYPLIFLIGIYYLHRDNVLSNYIIPWFVFSIGTILSFISNVLISFIEGMNKISFVQKHRLISSIINILFTIPIVALGYNLYGLALGMFVSSLYLILIIGISFKIIFLKLLLYAKIDSYNWLTEFLPLFKRYAISFASGFFILQIFIPVAHYFYGPIISGKIGISLALINSIFQISNIWIYTITPTINSFIANKKYLELDMLFNKRLLFSILTYSFFTVLFLLLFTTKNYIPLLNNILSRFLDPISLALLFLTYFLQLLINSWATYIRGFKIEPFVYPSFALSIYIVTIFLIIGNFYTYNYIFIGFASSYIWWLPLARYIFKKNKYIYAKI